MLRKFNIAEAVLLTTASCTFVLILVSLGSVLLGS
jgi:hypothetical protein